MRPLLSTSIAKVGGNASIFCGLGGFVLPIDGVSNQPNSLFSTFQGYIGLGWSVIPVRQKIAAVQWSHYQRHPPTLKQLRTWFADPSITGAAVITGQISGILVLDFDNTSLYRDFCRQHPQLTNSLTIKTKRGFHLYFKVNDKHLKSLRGQGIDLLYTGRYAILTGSVVDDHTYSIQQASAIRQLAPNDIKRIQGFMQQQGGVTPEKQQNTIKEQITPITSATNDHQQPSINVETLRNIYLSLSGNGQGRNNALFFAACLGRDHGLSCAEVTTALAQLHSIQPTPIHHRRENRSARYLEAARTIASAFKRPARPHTQEFKIPTGLPNAVRERLLEQEQVGVMRVIESLRLQGVQIGQGFTASQALALLKGIVGRDTVWAVLNSGLLVSPPYPLSNSYGVAKPLLEKQDKKCFLIGMTKSGISPAQRPAKVFIMPSNTEIAAKLSIRDGTLSDSLTLDDLTSSKNTRIALHRELLKRRPGQYPVKLFAKRLNVSVRTIQRYHAADPCFRREMVCDAQEITWFNIDTALPDVAPHGGCFLMDGKGKKYPCKRPIAQKLLARKQKVVYMRQRPNYWWYGEPEQVFFSKLDTPLPLAAGENHSIQDRHPLYALAEAEKGSVIQQTTIGQGMTEQFRDPPFQATGIRVTHYQPAVDPQRLEKQAIRLRNTINAMSNTEHQMSIGSARRLLDKHGEKAVWRAIRIVQSRNNVTKPVGLLSTILRSEARWKQA